MLTTGQILYILQGIEISLAFTFISLVIGGSFGLLLACIQFSRFRKTHLIVNVYISLFRGTPLLVQLSLVYFALPALIGINMNAFTAGVIAFSLNSAAYVCEIFRGGIQSVDKGQFLACQTLGLSHIHTMKDIILPQAFRNALPALMNEVISLLKETAIISIIGEADIMRRANIVAAENYTYLQPLLVAAACYYCLVLIFTYLATIIEKRGQYDYQQKSMQAHPA